MGSILEKLEQAIKDLLIGWIESNLTNMFTDVNTKVGTIAGEVGQTPSTWNSSIYQMIRGLSENVIVPIAGIIITFVLCYELITMITEKNNLHDMDTWMFFKWFFKAAVAIYLVTNTFDIVLAVFDIGQNVVAGAAGFIHGTTNIDIQATLDAMRTGMEAMSIEHDPYVLISILSALHEGEFTLDEVQGTLQMLFDKQYILTEEVIVETRYRTETDTWTDADGNTHTETYRVPYDYYICYVTLENFNLSHVPVYIMSQDELSMYATYMSGLGNREDLFPNSDYVGKYITNPPDEYTVNPAYLSDAKFATLIEEAEKYLNYPYVWGGSNPDTSFDCSGFVSYVLTNSGLVNTGRLGAQGLYNVCTPVSKANAQPGDLIFFQGTYDTPGVSHVGIYVGDGVMLHCGDPIQYTSINSSYWQSHFYAFGRPSY